MPQRVVIDCLSDNPAAQMLAKLDIAIKQKNRLAGS